MEDNNTRILNLGEKIQIKKLGEITVKELSLECLIKVSRELIAVFETINTFEESGGSKIFAALLADPKTLNALQMVAAESCEKTVEDFKGLPLSDWLRWLAAFKKVTDFEDLKDLFFQVVPREVVVKYVPSLKV